MELLSYIKMLLVLQSYAFYHYIHFSVLLFSAELFHVTGLRAQLSAGASAQCASPWVASPALRQKVHVSTVRAENSVMLSRTKHRSKLSTSVSSQNIMHENSKPRCTQEYNLTDLLNKCSAGVVQGAINR